MSEKQKLLKLIEHRILTLTTDEISVQTLLKIAVLLNINISEISIKEL